MTFELSMFLIIFVFAFLAGSLYIVSEHPRNGVRGLILTFSLFFGMLATICALVVFCAYQRYLAGVLGGPAPLMFGLYLGYYYANAQAFYKEPNLIRMRW